MIVAITDIPPSPAALFPVSRLVCTPPITREIMPDPIPLSNLDQSCPSLPGAH